MAGTKYIILERNEELLANSNESISGGYIFTGICADFNKNENARVYDKADYLRHLSYLKEEIAEGTLLGELDHPEEGFAVSMKNVSHKILDLWYDESENVVKIKIQLIATESGKKAMAVVDSGTPLHISSRAAGYISGGGYVTLDKIYTYDIVYKPGFKNARLARVNESKFQAFDKFNNDRVAVYEFKTFQKRTKSSTIMTNNSILKSRKPTKGKRLNEAKMIEYVNLISDTVNAHTKLLEGFKSGTVNESAVAASYDKISILEGKLNNLVKYSNSQTETINRLMEHVEKLTSYTNRISSTVNEHMDVTADVIRYSNLISTTVNESNTSRALLEKRLGKLVNYSNRIAETTNRLIESKGDDFDWKEKAKEDDKKEANENRHRKAGKRVKKAFEEGDDTVAAELKELEASIEDLGDDATDAEVKEIEDKIKELEDKTEDVSESFKLKKCRRKLLKLSEARVVDTKKNPKRVVENSPEDAKKEIAELETELEKLEDEGDYTEEEMEEVTDRISELEGEVEGITEKLKIKNIRRRVVRMTESVKINNTRKPKKKQRVVESIKAGRKPVVKGAITNQTIQRINEAKIQRAAREAGILEGKYPYITKVSARHRQIFESMNDTTRRLVSQKLANSTGNIDAVLIQGIIENAESMAPTLRVVDGIPTGLKPIWESLKSDEQNRIIANSKLRNLNSDYSISMFWRTMLESHQEIGVHRLNESTNPIHQNDNRMDNISTLGYSADQFV